jgi:hypothetical protein
MTKKKKKKFKPGDFVYGGATVFEIDNNGKKCERSDIGPNTKGKFKHKFFKRGK